MKRLLVVLAVSLTVVGCEQKAAEGEESEPSTAAQHANTNRAVLKAAGKAAKQIENKGEDRLKAADEAMKAGK